MGTRASVIFRDEKNKPMCAIYRQYDGYPEGLGKELQDIIEGGEIVNGLGSDRILGRYFNGPGCMFATIIANLKDQPGNVYICNVTDVGKQCEDFVYNVDHKGEVTWKQI